MSEMMAVSYQLELHTFLPPCRGKARMGVEQWGSQVSTPSPTLGETTSHSTRLQKTAAKSLVIPLQGGGSRLFGFIEVSNG
jgi:hypothetical protein